MAKMKFKPRPVDPAQFQELASKPNVRKDSRVSRGEILITGFLGSGVIIHSEKVANAKERDSLAISVRAYLAGAGLSDKVWARKLRGDSSALYLINIDSAPAALKKEFAAEQERNTVRTKKRKAAMKKKKK